ncbi:histone-lysine N-methyltransferase SETDB1-like [Chiloscyllium punctatum]|uniref:histone-lysine N-methyltransferase SETDB1-like n=1 Tax=Chiloscyllium punctatum TaxID=137246 RepID=UPI003B63571C
MASAETMDLAVEELGLSMDEIREWIDQELEKVDLLKQRRAALQELENWVEKKEAEMAHVDGLFEDASRSVDMCELMVKDLYNNLGLQYEEASTEEGTGKDSAKVSEVIEILDDDDDDDVMAVEPVETGQTRIKKVSDPRRRVIPEFTYLLLGLQPRINSVRLHYSGVGRISQLSLVLETYRTETDPSVQPVHADPDIPTQSSPTCQYPAHIPPNPSHSYTHPSAS